MSPERRVALVTGANKGIGYEIARLLGEEGFTVLAAGRDRVRIEAATAQLVAAGLDAVPIRMDITDGDSVADAAAGVASRFDALDVLVNNAGILVEPIGAGGTPSTTSIETVIRTYDTNVFGAIRVTNAFLPLARRSPHPRIVNVTSKLASLGWEEEDPEVARMLNLLAYNSSKTALNAITLAYARELADSPFKVNVVDPGHCATDINGNSGDRGPDAAAALPVWAATLPEDGPTGRFLREGEDHPW